MHLASGAAAEERDAAFRKVREGGPNPDKSADPETQSKSGAKVPNARPDELTCRSSRIPLRMGLHARG